jgi:pimeloyl-ACP methyl ester carboxylesterase
MPTMTVDGINTYYEVHGEGPPLLMFSPGGFDAVAANWTRLASYQRIDLLCGLRRNFTCITFDRREAGRSGARVQRLGWTDYVQQAIGLLDHLGHPRAHLMGGCVGCSVALAFAVAHPARTAGLVLYSPAGGPRYRLAQHIRFAEHVAFVSDAGLPAVVARACQGLSSFSRDSKVGPWAEAIRADDGFAAEYVGLDPDRYLRMALATARTMFDRDTVPGAEPEDLMGLDVSALIVPGEDASHAPSAAAYLHECLDRSRLWSVPVAERNQNNAAAVIGDFLAALA